MTLIPRRGRRRALSFLAGVLCLAALCGSTAVSPPSLRAATYPDVPLVPASSARAFGDSIGVNVRLSWLDTSYGNFGVVESRLRELGVRYVRDGLCATCDYNIDRLRRLAAGGVRAHLIAGSLAGGTAEMQNNLSAIRSFLRDAVTSIGAPNEPNLQGDPLWVEHTRAYQRELYLRVKGDPALAHLQVVGPAVAWPSSPLELGDLSAYLDRANAHPYPGGNLPLYNLASERLRAAAVAGTKPLVATEAGYHSDPTQVGHPHASERASGFYMPRLALEAFLGGVERTYIYQLADPWSEAERVSRGISVMENSFGLLRSDLTPKPAFLALRNLMRAVDSGSAPVQDAGGLRLGLEGASPDLRQLLLRSADGSYALVLWRQVSVWNHLTRHDVFPAAIPVDVVLGEPVALAQRFDPVASDAEVARWGDPQRIPVEVAGGPVVLRLTPPGVTPPAAAPTIKPKLSRTKRRQRLGKSVVVKASCVAPCAVLTAKGRLHVKRGKRQRSFKLKPARKRARSRVVILRLKIPAKGRRAANRALKHGGRVRARVAVTARSAAGAKLGTVRRTIVLTRRR